MYFVEPHYSEIATNLRLPSRNYYLDLQTYTLLKMRNIQIPTEKYLLFFTIFIIYFQILTNFPKATDEVESTEIHGLPHLLQVVASISRSGAFSR